MKEWDKDGSFGVTRNEQVEREAVRVRLGEMRSLKENISELGNSNTKRL